MDVSVEPRLTKLGQKVTDYAKRVIADKLVQGIVHLGDVTPVKTGAFADSMSLNPLGDTSGPSISSNRRELADVESTISGMTSRLDAQLQSIDLTEGATFVNNAPHANKVEERYAIFTTLADVLRRGTRTGSVNRG